ncbi:MAG TPA: hypothetical protein VFM55_14125 [Micromonosporaceae bacterium]|nr:hypothetical protein [Micromonosporaceae bacterium]
MTVADLNEVRPTVWTTSVGPDDYGEAGDRYRAAILDQYKVYVEMTDRISARRGLTNTFFLSFNTLVVATVGAFIKDSSVKSIYLEFPLAVLLLQCVAWFWLLRSYRQLNLAKFVVIGALEERLPASPYWRAEWKALGEGRDPARYWPLTHLEQWIPVSFAVVYASALAVALVG